MSRQLSLRTIGTRCVVFAIELAVFGILLIQRAGSDQLDNIC